MLFNLLFPLWLLVNPLMSFGQAADAQLAQLDFFFAARLRAFLWLCLKLYGLHVLIVSGRRTFAQQAQQHQIDSRNPAPDAAHPDVHMSGVAADLDFYDEHGKLVLGKKGFTAAQWAKVYALADTCGIENGSQFKGYADINHFFRRK